MATVSGTVKDADGNPVERIVRLYRRDTGALLDETTSEGGDPFWDDVGLSAPFRADLGDVKAGTDWEDERGNLSFDGGWMISDGAVGKAVFQGGGDIQFPDCEFTVEVTFQSSLLDNCGVFNVSGVFSLAVQQDGSMYVYVDYVGGQVVGTANDVLADTPTHILCVFDDDGADIYVDGRSVARVTRSWLGGYELYGVECSLSDGTCKLRDFRLTRGKRYTSNFTPEPTPYKDGGSGIYEFTTAYSGEVQVVALDNDAPPARNDLILRTTPV